MKLPIPDDYELGDGLTCFRVYWPDTPKWIGILQGLITTIQQGRLWDERTGSILGVQAIGREIESYSLPLALCCGDEVPSQPPNQEIISAIADCCESECCQMSCSIPYGALRWLNGVLQFRYCGEWYDVEGEPGESTPQPGEQEIPEDPSEVFGEATPCAKALAVWNVLIGVVDIILDGVEDLPPDLPGIYRAINQAYPEISWSNANLLNAITAAGLIRAQGYANEAEDYIFQKRILCAMAGVIDEGVQGLDEEQRKEVQDAISTSVGSVFNLSTYPTIFESVRVLYVYVYRAIGAKDTVMLTSYAKSTEDDDCACPGGEIGQSEPTENGWYLSEPHELTVQYQGYNTKVGYREILQHDVFGVVFYLDSVNTSANYKRMSPSSCGLTVDIQAWGDTSDHLEGYTWAPPFALANTTVKEELFGAGNFNDLGQSGFSSSNPAAPDVADGYLLGCGWWGDGLSEGQSFTVTHHWIHNINSPSHGE